MFTIVDLETTGGKPNKDRITEIAIIVHNGKRVIEHFTTLVNPQRPIDPFVVALTGISDEMVASAPTFDDIADKVLSLTEKKIFVAHNSRFDYGIMKHEFRRQGVHFQRKQLCTVQLSRKIFPKLPSYSLGKLCNSLEIPLEGRHRAYGDAMATTLLFERLMFNDRKELIESELKEGLEDSMLPPNINRIQLTELPDDAGVYYFTDQNDKILYIGKSKNIRKRVYSHFINDVRSEKSGRLKEQVHHIRHKVTGSELIAMLLESDEIKRFMPPFNSAQRRTKYRYGIFLRQDEEEFHYLAIDSLKMEEEPVIKVSNRRIAERLHNQILEKHRLDRQFAKLSKIRKNGNAEKLRESHNNQVVNALSQYFFPHPNFFLIDTAINPDEHSVVWVENNTYKGFGYFDPKEVGKEIDMIKDAVEFKYDNPDVQRIIRTWIRKHRKAQIITYDL